MEVLWDASDWTSWWVPLLLGAILLAILLLVKD